METIDDIVKELRESAELFVKDGVDQGLENPCFVFNEYADRIEKAKHEECRYMSDLLNEYRAENARLKAALKPVLECEYKAYHDGTGVWIDSPGRAVREAQSVYNEGER